VEVQTQVIKFFTGTTRDGSKQKWDVYFADGTKATAWEYDVAAKADEAHKSGATIIASIEEKPANNGGVFRNLKGVTLSPSLGNGSNGVPNTLSGVTVPQKPLGGLTGGGMTPEDKIRVTKLSCISSAAAIFSGSGDVQQTLEAAKAIFAEVMPAPAPEVAKTPEAVQQFVTEAAGANGLVTVGVTEEKPALPWAVA